MNARDEACKKRAADRVSRPDVCSFLVFDNDMDDAFVTEAVEILDEEKDLRRLAKKYGDRIPNLESLVEARIKDLPDDEQRQRCRRGQHEWIMISHTPQKYQYGSSYTQYKCRYCNAYDYVEDNGY